MKKYVIYNSFISFTYYSNIKNTIEYHYKHQHFSTGEAAFSQCFYTMLSIASSDTMVFVNYSICEQY